MRFLIITQYFQPEIGAPQVRLSAMARELQAQDHTVEVITALPNYPAGTIFPEYRNRFYCREQWEGITIHRFWLYAATGAGLKRLLNYFSFLFTSLFGYFYVKKPDYVFIESPPLFLGLHGFFAKLFWKAPMIFNVADLWPDSVRELGLMKEGMMLQFADSLERWIYKLSAYVNAVTEGIRKTLLTVKEVPEEKILFLPNGVETTTFKPREYNEPLARDLGLIGKKVILYAGTLGFAQGLKVMLEAMRLIEHELPEVQMVFIGSGSERAVLQSTVKEWGLKNVTFLEPAPPEYVAKLYSIAYAGFASLKNIPMFEGARPSKVFPVMGSGKPVIYSGAGEGAELIRSADAGVVSEPENPEALADSIRKLIADPERAEQMGKNGRKYAEDHLSWNALIRKWLDDLNTSERKKSAY